MNRWPALWGTVAAYHKIQTYPIKALLLGWSSNFTQPKISGVVSVKGGHLLNTHSLSVSQIGCYNFSMSKLVLPAMIALVLVSSSAGAQGVSHTTSKGNAYYAGGDLNISESYTGDIFAAGGNVSITGGAADDVLAAGGTVRLSGKVGGDARIAGGNVSIEKEIGGEAMIAGGNVRLLPGADVKGDLIAAAGDIAVEGNIGGSVRISGGNVAINGAVDKGVEVKAGRLIIGKNAVISGDLRYESPQEAVIEHGAVIKGEKIFKPREYARPLKKLMVLLWVWWFVKLFAVATAALVINFAMRKRTEEFTAFALSRFGRETLTGFVLLLMIPVAILILFATVLGALLGLIGVFAYIALITPAIVFGALVFSRLVGRYVFKKEQFLTWPVILLGVFLYEILGLIPVLGWLMKFVFFLSALGTCSHFIYTGLAKTSEAADNA